MVVKLQWKRARSTPRTVRLRTAPEPPPPPLTLREIEGGLAAILSPVAAMLFAVSLWRLGQDLGLAANFFVEEGPLAHWQPWFALAAGLALVRSRLNRRSQSGGDDAAAAG